MLGITVKLFFALVLQTFAKDAMVGNLGDSLVNKLLDRTMSSQNVDLDNTMLGKPGTLPTRITPGTLPTRPVMPFNSNSLSISHAMPAMAYKPTFRSTMISRGEGRLDGGGGDSEASGDGATAVKEKKKTMIKQRFDKLRTMNAEQLMQERKDQEIAHLKLINKKAYRQEMRAQDMTDIRKDIARILRVYSEKQKAEGKEKYPPVPYPYWGRNPRYSWTRRERRAYRDNEEWKNSPYYVKKPHPPPGRRSRYPWKPPNVIFATPGWATPPPDLDVVKDESEIPIEERGVTFAMPKGMGGLMAGFEEDDEPAKDTAAESPPDSTPA